MEVRFKTDDNFMRNLQNILGLKNASEVTREALTLLNWIADEVKHGRIILSSTKDLKEMHRLVSPWIMDKIEKNYARS